jgi:hypothetical protein
LNAHSGAMDVRHRCVEAYSRALSLRKSILETHVVTLEDWSARETQHGGLTPHFRALKAPSGVVEAHPGGMLAFIVGVEQWRERNHTGLPI